VEGHAEVVRREVEVHPQAEADSNRSLKDLVVLPAVVNNNPVKGKVNNNLHRRLAGVPLKAAPLLLPLRLASLSNSPLNPLLPNPMAARAQADPTYAGLSADTVVVVVARTSAAGGVDPPKQLSLLVFSTSVCVSIAMSPADAVAASARIPS
jgi:hypothetical protein